jgi:tetratricopeptide (TPR) repeat protein
VLGFLIFTAAGATPALAQEAATCAPAVARVVSIQGPLEVQRAGSSAWLQIKRLDTSVCAGDRLRTGPLARAALFVEPETLVRVDRNTTIALSVTTAEIVVEFFQDDVAGASLDTHSCGAGYFITRFPKKFRVSAPHLNAAVEGTEFQVALRCDATELAVLEGAVRSETLPAREERVVTGGQLLVASPTAPAAFSTVVKPTDAVQWVLYYPPLSDAKSEAEVPTAEQCRGLPSPSNQRCLTERAEVLLRLGRGEAALQDINEALALNPANGDANALRAIIHIARNDKAAALESSAAATSSAPNNYRAWLAQSYAQQASFELEQALDSATKAQALESNSSLVSARIAELLMSLGRVDEAEAAARAGVIANAAESRAHTMLGFVHLAQNDTRQARVDFQAAIERDSFNPLARLGLGLAMIRDGKLVEGRKELEIAVALDPTNSLLRSYVGKAYYEEKTAERNELAEAQFGLAKEFDLNDPTPWLYDAIGKQTTNRPVEALHDIQRSIELNDNRAVFRSALKIDEDLATRSASQGRIYRDLGFESLAVLEGWKSVNTDPGNFSGHRLLADTYSSLPRHEMARVNELFASQLLQPLNLTPVPPQLGEANLFILDSAGPADIAFNEFNPLFNRNRLSVQASGTIAGNDTWGQDVALAGVQDRWSFSLGQFHFETDGFRQNNDLEQDVYNAFVQFRQSENTSLLTELRATRRDQGDLQLLFDPDNFIPDRRQKEDTESVRIGAHHALNPRSELLASLVYQNADFETALPPSLDVSGEADTYTAEVQHIYTGSRWRLVSGLRHTNREQSQRQTLVFQVPDPPFLMEEITQQRFKFDTSSVYAYSYTSIAESVNLILGASGDFVEGRSVDEDQISPKIGLTWEPSSDTLVRMAAFRTIQPDSFSRQDILPRLEPTQVGGFNQVFSGGQGENEWRYGLGLDHHVSTDLFIGAEASKRDINIPIIFLGPPEERAEFSSKEYSARSYVFWTPSSGIAVTVTYQYDKQENDEGAAIEEGILELRTHRAPFGVRFFHPSGFSAEATTTYVDQKGEFQVFIPDPPFVDVATDGDTFWVVDAALRYRLPRRSGIITASVKNLLDEEFQFQDVDPENPEIFPERLVSLKLTVAF